eukprot:4136699-Amphidinium_carterae.1
MKAHQTHTAVDNGMLTAANLHGNGQVDELANQGTAAHGPLELDATWICWSDFANTILAWLEWCTLKQLGPHLRVVRHSAFLQCLESLDGGTIGGSSFALRPKSQVVPAFWVGARQAVPARQGSRGPEDLLPAPTYINGMYGQDWSDVKHLDNALAYLEEIRSTS